MSNRTFTKSIVEPKLIKVKQKLALNKKEC